MLDPARPWRHPRYYVVPVGAVYFVQVVLMFAVYTAVVREEIPRAFHFHQKTCREQIIIFASSLLAWMIT